MNQIQKKNWIDFLSFFFHSSKIPYNYNFIIIIKDQFFHFSNIFLLIIIILVENFYIETITPFHFNWNGGRSTPLPLPRHSITRRSVILTCLHRLSIRARTSRRQSLSLSLSLIELPPNCHHLPRARDSTVHRCSNCSVPTSSFRLFDPTVLLPKIFPPD